MTCKGLAHCPTTCLHAQLVRAYHEERERQETEVEQQTARERGEYDLITYKQWLQAHSTPEGRHRPDAEQRRRQLADKRRRPQGEGPPPPHENRFSA